MSRRNHSILNRRIAGTLLFAPALIALFGGTATAATKHVDVVGNAYQPASLQVSQGDTVVWHNHDSVKHTVTSTDGGGMNSGNFGQEQQFAFTFSKAGAFSYYCEIHPNMKGTVSVQAGAAPKPAAPAPKPTAKPVATAPAKPAVVTTETPASTTASKPVVAPAVATPASEPVAAAAGTAAPDPTTEPEPKRTPVTVTASEPASAEEQIDPLLLLGALVAGVLVFVLLALEGPRLLPTLATGTRTPQPAPRPKSTAKKPAVVVKPPMQEEAAILTVAFPSGSSVSDTTAKVVESPQPAVRTPATNGRRRKTTPPPSSSKTLVGAGRR